jgi:hypothetical protein
MSGAVRRSVAIAGLTGLLVLGGGAAYAEDPLPPDNPTTVDCGLPVDEGNLPPDDGGQGIAVGEPAPDGSGSVDPAKPDPGTVDPAKPDPATDPAAPPSDTHTVGIPTDEPVDPDAVVCIAAGMPMGGVPVADSSSGGGGAEVAPVAAPVAAPAEQLPRTGPAPVLPTLALGSWLLLLGVLAVLAAPRRTNRA